MMISVFCLSCSEELSEQNVDQVKLGYVTLAHTSNNAPVESCPNGGVTLHYGVDEDGNGGGLRKMVPIAVIVPRKTHLFK